MNPEQKTDWGRFLLPLLFHLSVSELSAFFLGKMTGQGTAGSSDTAAVGLASAVCIPVFLLWLSRWSLSAGKTDSPAAGSPGRPAEMRQKRRCRRWTAAAPFAGAGLSVLWGILSGFLHLSDHFSDQTQQQLYAAPLVLQIVVLAVLSPVCEELLFRGLLFRQLKLSAGEEKSAVIVSLIFALYHGNPIQMLYAFPMALILQLFARKTRSLVPPVLLHAAANLTSVLVQSLFIPSVFQ